MELLTMKATRTADVDEGGAIGALGLEVVAVVTLLHCRAEPKLLLDAVLG